MYKRYKSVLFILAAFAIISCGKTETPETKKNDKEVSGVEKHDDEKLTDDFIVEYNVVGALNGTMNIMRSGNKMKQIINSEMMGMKNLNTIYIVNGTVYTITDIGGKEFATKTGLADFNKQKETGETIVDFKEFEKFLDSKTIAGNENIIGYNCDIYDLGNNVSISVYKKRYILKIKSSQFMATASRIDAHPSFAAGEFDIPSNVQFGIATPKELNKKNLDSIVNKLSK